MDRALKLSSDLAGGNGALRRAECINHNQDVARLRRHSNLPLRWLFLYLRKEEEIITKISDLKQHYLSSLNESLSSFKDLLNIEYKIKVARKGVEQDIELVFLKRNFVHLAGLEKLIDVPIVNAYRDLYAQLSQNESLSELIKAKLVESKYFDFIVDRLYSIIDLRDNFYNAKDNKHYKFISKERGNFTSIDYDFIIKCEFEKDIYYYFLRRDEKSDKANQYVLVSLFMNNEKDYTKAQAYMSLLEKIEIDRSTNRETIIYKKEHSL